MENPFWSLRGVRRRRIPSWQQEKSLICPPSEATFMASITTYYIILHIHILYISVHHIIIDIIWIHTYDYHNIAASSASPTAALFGSIPSTRSCIGPAGSAETSSGVKQTAAARLGVVPGIALDLGMAFHPSHNLRPVSSGKRLQKLWKITIFNR
jgi:hypothetical protein